MKRILFLSSFVLVSFLSINIWAAMPGKFLEVSPGIYRSAQPNMIDMKDLMKFGIKTIIDLNDDKATLAAEQKEANRLGIQFIAQPMSAFRTPNDSQVDEILQALVDQNNYPILIHCKHGEDRTGLIIGLHRVYEESWQPNSAYREMLDLGFHKVLVKLDRYFKQTTGWSY